MTMTLTTPAFIENSTLPTRYTCDGEDVSPAFSWQNAPKNTQAFALVCHDPDAPGGTFYHWVIYNIPKNMNSLAEGVKTLPTGAIVGKSSWGKPQYNGACPPRGSTHHYIFTLYALDAPLSLSAHADGQTVEAAVSGHVLEKASVTAIYQRE